MSVTPQVTITGKLQDLFGAVVSGAYLIFQLCGYGAQLPRVAGTSMLAKTAPDQVPVAGDGTFSKPLYGNDAITPAGTFYTIQVQDDNGNIVQTGSFQFTGSGSLDLSTVAPFDPANPIPPAPTPTVLGGNVTVPFSATPIFDCSLVSPAGVISFQMTLTGNVASSTLINAAPGQIVTFHLIQDGTGGRTMTWPANVHNAGIIKAAAGGTTTQSFYVRADGALFAMGPGMYN